MRGPLRYRLPLWTVLVALAGCRPPPPAGRDRPPRAPATPETGWRWVQPLPQGNTLLAVSVSGSDIVAVGELGTIVRSADAGRTWSVQRVGDATLRGVSRSGNLAWAVGDGGTLLRSEDGGRHFRPAEQRFQSDLRAVWAAGGATYIAGSQATLLRGDGGGFTQLPVPSKTDLNAVAGDARGTIAVAGDDGVVLRLDPTGKLEKLQTPTRRRLLAVVVDGPRILAIGDDVAIYSGDGGRSWRTRERGTFTRAMSAGPDGTVFLAGGIGDASLGRGAIDRVVGDPRLTVMLVAEPVAGLDLDSLPELNGVSVDGNVVAVGVGGTMLSSADGGSSWQRLTGGGVNLHGVWAGPDGDAYAVGTNGVILRRQHPGAEWSPVFTAPNEANLSAIWGSATGELFAVGREGSALLRGTHHGEKWELVPHTGFWFTDIWGSGQTIVVVGRSILHSQDGGRSWSEGASDVAAHLSAVGGRSASDLYAVGSGQILHSVDRGATWRSQPAPDVDLSGVWANASTVFVVGDQGTILRSVEGGPWVPLAANITENLSAITGTRSGTLIVAAWDGSFWRSTDLGNLWTPMKRITSNGISRVFATEAGQLFAVGSAGTILFAPRAAD